MAVTSRNKTLPERFLGQTLQIPNFGGLIEFKSLSLSTWQSDV